MSDEEKVDDTTEVDESKATEEEEDESKDNQSEEEIDWQARALKAEKTAENYKKENQKYRKPREVEEPIKPEVDETSKEFVLQESFFNKREDVLYEYKSQIQELTDEEWNEIKDIIPSRLDSAYKQASKDGRYVSKGELDDAIKKLISFAKRGREQGEAIEKARLEALKDNQNLNNAEIGGIKGRKPKIASEEVKRLIDEKGWSLEESTEIIKKRQERESEYAPKHTI